MFALNKSIRKHSINEILYVRITRFLILVVRSCNAMSNSQEDLGERTGDEDLLGDDLQDQPENEDESMEDIAGLKKTVDELASTVADVDMTFKKSDKKLERILELCEGLSGE
jgi:hypothetical protein